MMITYLLPLGVGMAAGIIAAVCCDRSGRSRPDWRWYVISGAIIGAFALGRHVGTTP